MRSFYYSAILCLAVSGAVAAPPCRAADPENPFKKQRWAIGLPFVARISKIR